MTSSKQLKSTEDLERLFRLRFNAWSTRVNLEKYFPNRKFQDKYDLSSMHWGTWKNCDLVAGASLYIANSLEAIPHTEKIASYMGKYRPPYHVFRRLVVSPNERHQGLSSALDKTRVETILEHRRGTALVVVSQEFRARNLSQYGFQRACRLGEFKTFPGGDSILLIAKCQDLFIPNESYPSEKYFQFHDDIHLHQTSIPITK